VDRTLQIPSARAVLVCCVLPLLLAVPGCSATGQAPAAPPAPTAPAAPSPGPGPAPDGSAASGQPAPATPQDAALRLESLLGQHAVLAADMMRGRIRNDEDFGQAANAAIGRNTDDLGQLVGALFGQDAADQFRPMWSEHVGALFTYSKSLVDNDTATRDRTRASLVDFETDLAGFFSAASQGRLDDSTARSAVTTHVEHLLDQADAYAAGDYARANADYRAGYSHTFALGHALASTLLPPDQAAVLNEPQWRLRSELGRQLGEHVALTVGTLRAGATNSPDFDESASALNANTSELTASMGSLFGQAAGDEFMTLWADHVDQLVAYTAGVAAGDEGRRSAARAGLRDGEQRLATFLDTTSGSRLGSAPLAQVLATYDDTLVSQVDAFVAKDYPRANDLSYRAYQDMFGMARQLSDAFGAMVAARLPEGGAQTGAGGTVPGRR
jgi:hypothetical protein